MKRFLILFVFVGLQWPVVAAAENATAAIERRREALDQLPKELRAKWKKFGEWDYKQFDHIYKDFTAYNFGATGSAAGLSSEQLHTLLRIANPTPHDITYMGSLELKNSFAKRKAGLEVLLQMLAADAHLNRVSREFTSVVDSANWPKGKDHLPKSRLQDYRKRFDALGLREGVIRTKDFADAVFFVVDAEGLCVAGASCGYIHSPTALPDVGSDPVTALGQFARENPKSGGKMVFEKLDDEWFAFYEIDWQ